MSQVLALNQGGEEWSCDMMPCPASCGFEHRMLQSRVGITPYSVVHLNCVTVFKALKCRAFIKGGACTHYTDMSGTYAAVLLHV